MRVAAVGLCRTDYHVMRGERRVAMRPMVLGHEASGIVETVGAAVDGIRPGDHVVLTFIPGCGQCHWCRRGLHHLCARGAGITQGPQLDGSYRRRDLQGNAVGAFCMIGGFAERTVVDQASVVVIDRDIPFDLASLVACGVTAGVGAARHRARVKPGERVLVVGCGGDGMNVVQGAAAVRRRPDHRRGYRAGKTRLGPGVWRDRYGNAQGEALTGGGAAAAPAESASITPLSASIRRRPCLPAFRATAQGRQCRGDRADPRQRDRNQDSAA